MEKYNSRKKSGFLSAAALGNLDLYAQQ